MSGHAEIFSALQHEILAGKFDSDKRLPSESALAERFGCSRPTISRVTLDLKREGLIITRKGAPSMVTPYALNATGALGLVVPGESYTEIFKPIIYALSKLAEHAGWDLIQGEIKSDKPSVRAREARRLAYQFSKEHVAGVFFHPLELIKDATRANMEVISFFERADIAVVLLDFDILLPPERSRYDMVGIDNLAAGLAVGRHLLRHGAKRLAFNMRAHAAATITKRMTGVMAAVVEAGREWSHRNVLVADPRNVRAVSRFLNSFRPDAIVAGNDVTAVRLLETLRQIGGGAEKIRLAGFDDVAIAEQAGITTVRQPLDDLASTALQTLISRIKSPELPPRTILLHAPLVVR